MSAEELCARYVLDRVTCNNVATQRVVIDGHPLVRSGAELPMCDDHQELIDRAREFAESTRGV